MHCMDVTQGAYGVDVACLELGLAEDLAVSL